jgi:hypothetical protein
MKYPSTPYADPDKVIPVNYIATIKRDGENSTVYSNGDFHLRSLSSTTPSKDGRAKVWATSFVSHLLLKHVYNRMVFENCYDQHSIHYSVANGNPLESFYQCILITELYERDGREFVVDYNQCARFCQYYGIGIVPFWKLGLNESKASNYIKDLDTDKEEGLVFRNAGKFPFDELSSNVCKAVRPNHIQTDSEWRRKHLPPNEVVYKENLLERLLHD